MGMEGMKQRIRLAAFGLILLLGTAPAFSQEYSYSKYYDFPDDRGPDNIGLDAVTVCTTYVGGLYILPQCRPGRLSTFTYSVYDGDRLVWSHKAVRGEREVMAYVEGIVSWTADTPARYTLRISGRSGDDVVLPLLFRDVRYSDRKLNVNGYANIGYKAVKGDDVNIDDLAALKDMNFNMLVVDEITEALDSAALTDGMYLFSKKEVPGWEMFPSSKEMLGMSTADRMEVTYKNRPVRSICIVDEKRLDILNNSFLKGMKLHLDFLHNGSRVSSRDVDLWDMPVMGTKSISLDMSAVPDKGDIFLNVMYTCGNMVISSEQFMIREEVRLFRPKSGRCCVNIRPKEFVIEGDFKLPRKHWTVSIDRKTGALASYVVGGKELIGKPLMPVNWTPDNLNGVQIRHSGDVIVASRFGVMQYTVNGDGSIEVNVKGNGPIRFEMGLPAEDSQTRYYGRGPGDIPSSEYTYGKMGVYTQPVGTAHTDLRWMDVKKEGGYGMRFLSDSSFALGTSAEEGMTVVRVQGTDNEFQLVLQPIM